MTKRPENSVRFRRNLTECNGSAKFRRHATMKIIFKTTIKCYPATGLGALTL